MSLSELLESRDTSRWLEGALSSIFDYEDYLQRDLGGFLRLNACYSAFFFHLDSQGSLPKYGATYSGQVSLPPDNLQECPEPMYQVILYSTKLTI